MGLEPWLWHLLAAKFVIWRELLNLLETHSFTHSFKFLLCTRHHSRIQRDDNKGNGKESLPSSNSLFNATGVYNES